MKYIKLLIILLCILSLTGCYNYRELNDLGIATAIGISMEDNEYKLAIEVVETEGSTEETPKYTLIESRSKTVEEALRHSILKSSKRLYINHLSLLIIDETLAESGIKDIIDLFFRDSESRKQFYVLISKVSIKDLLSTETPLISINSKSIKERLETNDKYLNNVSTITFSKLLSDYVNPYKEIVIPSITLKDDEITLEDSAIFKEDKLVGYISNDDTLYYNFILNNVDDTVISIKDIKTSIEMNESKTHLDIHNNHININIEMNGNITEINDIDLTNPNGINYIENIYENYLNSNISNMIHNTIYKYDSDIFGFKDLVYKKDYQNIDKFNLKDLNIKVNTKVNIKYKGNGASIINER